MTFQAPPELESAVGEILKRYPGAARSALLPVLQAVQDRFGCVSDPAVEWIAGRLELPPIVVLEVLTFYPGLRRKAPGRHLVRVCRTLSCEMAGGGKFLRKHILDKLGLKEPADGHAVSTPDGRVTVEFVECLASCGTGPALMIGDQLHEHVTPEKADQLLSGLD